MDLKPIMWVASSKKDLRGFPDEVKGVMGHALYLAQVGDKHDQAKALKGFGSAAVLEVIEDFQGDTYRAVYTVKYADAIYVLHAFQKKSHKGIATPKPDADLIKRRLKTVEEQHQERSRRKIKRIS